MIGTELDANVAFNLDGLESFVDESALTESVERHESIDSIEPEDVEYDDLDISTNQFGEVARQSYPSDILHLTPIENGNMTPSSYGVVAEYHDVDIVSITKKQQDFAHDFIKKIEKFVLGFNDVQLTEAHREYVEQVGMLQLQNLSDLMVLTDANKQMIANLVARINATQAEDYTIIATYNNLVNQHIKLMRELSTVYKAIPSVMKKMRNEVLTEGDVDGSQVMPGVVTEHYGETQFNNSKELIKILKEKKEQKSSDNQ